MGSESMQAGSSSSGGSGAVNTWMCATGSLLLDSLYNGVLWDARLETAGWLQSGYSTNTSAWSLANRIADPGGVMSSTASPKVEIMETLDPISMWESTPGSYVFDFGQNFAGVTYLRLPSNLPAGISITMKHAESILHPPYGDINGSLYYGNLRTALATDTYITRGSTVPPAMAIPALKGYSHLDYEVGETFFPLFTWHGFRYVELIGLPFAPSQQGVVVGMHFRSAVKTAGSVAFPETANVMNQLQHAVFWSQGDNLMGNPSDCPQRDERLGWTGDSALSGEQSSFNFDMSAFYTLWTQNLLDASSNIYDPMYPGSPGAFPNVVPDVLGNPFEPDLSWDSVFPSTIYTVYKAYGDALIVQMQWPHLLQYVQDAMQHIDNKKYSTWGE